MTIVIVRTRALAALIPHLTAHDIAEIDAEIRAVRPISIENSFGVIEVNEDHSLSEECFRVSAFCNVENPIQPTNVGQKVSALVRVNVWFKIKVWIAFIRQIKSMMAPTAAVAHSLLLNRECWGEDQTRAI